MPNITLTLKHLAGPAPLFLQPATALTTAGWVTSNFYQLVSIFSYLLFVLLCFPLRIRCLAAAAPAAAAAAAKSIGDKKERQSALLDAC